MQFFQRRYVVALLSVLFLGLYASEGAARDLVLTIGQQEYSAPSRSGTLRLYIPDSPSPLAGDPYFAQYYTGLWAEASWEAICTSNIYMSGGTAQGWLLGPLYDPELLSIYSWFLSGTASTAFAVLVGDTFGLGGSGTRNHCGGSVTQVQWGLILIFIRSQPDGNYFADLWYITEISDMGEWYKLTL